MLSRRVQDCANELMCLPIFSGFKSQEILDVIEGSTIAVSYDKDRLFSQGHEADFFGYILSGAYKLEYADGSGFESILYVGYKGEALAIMGVLETEAIFPFSGVSLGCSRFLRIPRETFMKKWLGHPTLMLRFQNDLQRRIFQSYNEKLACQKGLPGRIAHLLLYFAHNKSGNSSRLEFALTRREIAGCLGVSVEAVIRTMSDWTKKKWLRSDEGFIKIQDSRALAELANGVDLVLQKESSGSSVGPFSLAIEAPAPLSQGRASRESCKESLFAGAGSP